LELSTRRTLDECKSVQTAILISIKESPSYKNPLSPLADATYKIPLRKETRRENMDTVIRRLKHAAKDINPRSEILRYDQNDKRSPLLFHGVLWVGRMYAELEIWTRDSSTGKAIRRQDPIVSTTVGNQK
jgi:hypothetical protein